MNNPCELLSICLCDYFINYGNLFSIMLDHWMFTNLCERPYSRREISCCTLCSFHILIICDNVWNQIHYDLIHFDRSHYPQCFCPTNHRRQVPMTYTFTGHWCKFNESRSFGDVLVCRASPRDHDLPEGGHIHHSAFHSTQWHIWIIWDFCHEQGWNKHSSLLLSAGHMTCDLVNLI